MPFADTSLRDEYGAAVERVAGRALDALRGAGGAIALADPAPSATAPRAALAAVRALGPDVFAPQLLDGTALDAATARAAAEAFAAFPPLTAEQAGPAGPVVGLRDRTTAELLSLAGHLARAPQPAPLPTPEAVGWQAWTVSMAQLSSLALPGLDGPAHQDARRHALLLARGTVRSMLRRDHRVAARLTRWLALLQSEGGPCPLEPAPVLARIRAVGDGSARTALELAVADRLLAGPAR